MSKQRKLRSKLSFQEDDEGAGEDGQQQAPRPPPPPPAGGGAKREGGRPKNASLLSFGDDEEPLVGPARPKKDKAAARTSKFSRGSGGGSVGAAPGALAAAAAPASTQRPAAGEYTAERLAELQAATQKLPGRLKPQPAAAEAAGVIKLSGSFKQAPKADGRFSYSVTGHIAGGAGGGGGGAAGAPPAAEASAPPPLDDNEALAAALPPPPRPGGKAGAAGGPGRRQAAAGSEGAEDEDEEEEDEDEGFALPDEETIKLAKAKRERLRQAHLAPDYLPLGGTSRLLGGASAAATSGAGAGSGAGRRAPKARAAGSDGEGSGGAEGSGSDRDGSGGGSDAEAELEERMRLAFVGQQPGGAGGSAARRGGGGGAAAALAGGQYASTVQDHDSEDEEMWEAGAAAAAGGEQQRLARAIRRNAAGGSAKLRDGLGGRGGFGALSGAAAGERREAIRAAGAGVLASLLEAADRAGARAKHLNSNLARTSDNLAGALEEAERIRDDIKQAGAKYAAVQSLKAYLSDLADCLAAKAPLAEELQDSLEAARQEAAAALREQERTDDQILCAQAEAAVGASLAVLGSGGAAADAAAAAEAAAREAEASAVAAAAGGGGQGKPEVDEFGRDLSFMRRKQLEKGKGRREARVARLTAQLEALRAGGRLDLEASGDGAQQQQQPPPQPPPQQQEPDALREYRRRRDEVLQLAPTVFADADEQYASLAAVKARLEGFKAQYPREYGSAYLGESAAALFAPFVRLELLRWEPLPLGAAAPEAPQANGAAAPAADQQQQQQQQQQQGGFDSQEWYSQLFEYGLSAGGAADGGAAGPDDPDANLVPQLVESLVLPMALQLVARCWDPARVAQSQAVASLVSDLFVYVPADREEMAELLSLTTGALEAAAAAAVVPPWPAAAAAASPLAQAVLQARFARAAGVLRALVGFRELLSQALLAKLALGVLVGQQLVPCLRSSLGDLPLGLARAEAVAGCLPASWFADAAAVPREAQPLLDVLSSLARSIEAAASRRQQQQPDSGPGGGAQLAGFARRAAVLLLHVGLREPAARLGHVFGFAPA